MCFILFDTFFDWCRSKNTVIGAGASIHKGIVWLKPLPLMCIRFLRLLRMQQQRITTMSTRTMPSRLDGQTNRVSVSETQNRREMTKRKIYRERNNAPPPAATKNHMLMPNSISGKTKPGNGRRKGGRTWWACAKEQSQGVGLKQGWSVLQKCSS